ncbi:hypothetical protein H1C71_007283 [Ictidomys tridecemlineatus]|nr:hypothetical protein H1C71_007283 [Ictidomys tridecemlineatus]
MVLYSPCGGVFSNGRSAVSVAPPPDRPALTQAPVCLLYSRLLNQSAPSSAQNPRWPPRCSEEKRKSSSWPLLGSRLLPLDPWLALSILTSLLTVPENPHQTPRGPCTGDSVPSA